MYTKSASLFKAGILYSTAMQSTLPGHLPVALIHPLG